MTYDVEKLVTEFNEAVAYGFICHVDFIDDFFDGELRQLSEIERADFDNNTDKSSLTNNEDDGVTTMLKLNQIAKKLDAYNDSSRSVFDLDTKATAYEQLVEQFALLDLTAFNALGPRLTISKSEGVTNDSN